MPSNIIFDRDALMDYPHRLHLVWRTFIADKYNFTEASQWLEVLISMDDRVHDVIERLDDVVSDYIVVITRSVFFQPYYAHDRRLVRVCAYLLFNDSGHIAYRLLFNE